MIIFSLFPIGSQAFAAERFAVFYQPGAMLKGSYVMPYLARKCEAPGTSDRAKAARFALAASTTIV